jgi:hypothetical protein
MVAGSDTFINELLKLNHFQNIYEIKDVIQKSNSKNTFRGWSWFGFPVIGTVSFKKKMLWNWQFTHHAKTVFVDGEMFSWHGKALKAFDYFKKCIKNYNSHSLKSIFLKQHFCGFFTVLNLISAFVLV